MSYYLLLNIFCFPISLIFYRNAFHSKVLSKISNRNIYVGAVSKSLPTPQADDPASSTADAKSILRSLEWDLNIIHQLLQCEYDEYNIQLLCSLVVCIAAVNPTSTKIYFSVVQKILYGKCIDAMCNMLEIHSANCTNTDTSFTAENTGKGNASNSTTTPSSTSWTPSTPVAVVIIKSFGCIANCVTVDNNEDCNGIDLTNTVGDESCTGIVSENTMEKILLQLYQHVQIMMDSINTIIVSARQQQSSYTSNSNNSTSTPAVGILFKKSFYAPNLLNSNNVNSAEAKGSKASSWKTSKKASSTTQVISEIDEKSSNDGVSGPSISNGLIIYSLNLQPDDVQQLKYKCHMIELCFETIIQWLQICKVRNWWKCVNNTNKKQKSHDNRKKILNNIQKLAIRCLQLTSLLEHYDVIHEVIFYSPYLVLDMLLSQMGRYPYSNQSTSLYTSLIMHKLIFPKSLSDKSVDAVASQLSSSPTACGSSPTSSQSLSLAPLSSHEGHLCNLFDEYAIHFVVEGEMIISICEDHTFIDCYDNKERSNFSIRNRNINSSEGEGETPEVEDGKGNESKESELLVVIRNRSGKYVYRMQPLFDLKTPSLPSSSSLSRTTSIASPVALARSTTEDVVVETPATGEVKGDMSVQLASSSSTEDKLRKGIETLQNENKIMFWNRVQSTSNKSPSTPNISHVTGYDGSHHHVELSINAADSTLQSCFGLTSAWMNPFTARLNAQKELEQKSIKSSAMGMHEEKISEVFIKLIKTDSAVEPSFDSNVENDNSGSNSWYYSSKVRHLLSKLGYLQYEKLGRFMELKNDIKLLTNLEILDSCAEREQHNVHIMFTKNIGKTGSNGNHSSIQILQHDCACDAEECKQSPCEEYSKQYISFLRSLGEIVNLDTHLGES